MILLLPLPPSRNVVEGLRHPLHAHTAKRRYQKKCWAAAVSQQKPDRDPPEHVTIRAHFRVHNLRDDDGLDLKWVLDTLRQAQTGNLRWRKGLYDECGYFIDDDPAHLTLLKSTQAVDRKNKSLTLEILP